MKSFGASKIAQGVCEESGEVGPFLSYIELSEKASSVSFHLGGEMKEVKRQKMHLSGQRLFSSQAE
jgi:hypothetical protein